MPDPWQNALSVKIYKADVRKIQKIRSYEKQVTKQQQKRSRNSTVTHSCDQWTKIEVGNLIGLLGQIGDAMILSLPKRVYIIYIHLQKNELCTRRWYHLLLVRVHTIRDKKCKLSVENCTEKPSCVLSFSLKYTLICSFVSMMTMMMSTDHSILHNQITRTTSSCWPSASPFDLPSWPV